MHIEIVRPDFADYQKEILYNEARFTVTEASTKCGKTFAHIYWIFERAHEPWNKPGYNHWWAAPIYDQTKIAFNRLRSKLARTGRYKINESNLSITCPNGAVIRFKSAEKPDSLYGEDVYSIVFDEAPRARVEAHYALRSTITATGGKYKLIGNFRGTSNWVHQLKEKAGVDPEYFYKKITAWDAVEAGILSRGEVEQAQRDLPANIFAQLYLAEDFEGSDMLCSYASINDLFTNTHAKTGSKYISADIALHGSDKFVVVVWDDNVIIDISIVDKCEAPEVEALIKSKADAFSVPRSHIVYDSDGVGSFLRGYLQNANPFNNGGKPIGDDNYKNLKSQCGFALAKRVNAGEIYVKQHNGKSEIIKEMECLRSDALDKDGKLQIWPKKKIRELLGHSPDILDALMMKMYFHLPRPTFPKSWISHNG